MHILYVYWAFYFDVIATSMVIWLYRYVMLCMYVLCVHVGVHVCVYIYIYMSVYI